MTNWLYLAMLAVLVAAALFEAIVHTVRRDHDWKFTVMLYGLALLGVWEAGTLFVERVAGWWCDCALTNFASTWPPFGIALIVALVASSIVLFDHAEFGVSFEDRMHGHPHVAGAIGYAAAFGAGALFLHLVQAMGLA